MSRFKISSLTPSAIFIRSIFILISEDSSWFSPGKDFAKPGVWVAGGYPGSGTITHAILIAWRLRFAPGRGLDDGRRWCRMACGPVESSELTEVSLSACRVRRTRVFDEEESGAARSSAGYASEPPTVSPLRARRPSTVLGCTIVASNAHPSVISANIRLCTPCISLLGHVTFIVVRVLHTREWSSSCDTLRETHTDAYRLRG